MLVLPSTHIDNTQANAGQATEDTKYTGSGDELLILKKHSWLKPTMKHAAPADDDDIGMCLDQIWDGQHQ